MNMFSGLKGRALKEEERTPLINFPTGWGLTWAGNSWDLQYDCHGERRAPAQSNEPVAPQGKVQEAKYCGPGFGPITRQLFGTRCG